jgi:hypothetical protein
MEMGRLDVPSSTTVVAVVVVAGALPVTAVTAVVARMGRRLDPNGAAATPLATVVVIAVGVRSTGWPESSNNGSALVIVGTLGCRR